MEEFILWSLFSGWAGVNFFVAVAGLLVLVLVYLIPRSKGMALPPSPRAWPLVGHLFHLVGRNPHITCANLSKTLGPIMFLTLGQMKVVVVNSAVLAEEVLKTKGHIFSSRCTSIFTEVLMNGNKGFVMSDSSEYWRFVHKVVTSELSSPKRI
ncbi:hypothetical protein Mapa_014234 [Marchantia paleacea]|nr:hypothetical protein Mapa_014234 [Marchantia paleacea]